MAINRKTRLPSIAYIVARSYPGHVIGCDNKLPWHLKSDLIRFKDITKNSAVIMGRKTFDSIGRPLPNRLNIVITRSKSIGNHDVVCVPSREDAIFVADIYSLVKGRAEFFVIGGSKIYELFLDLFYKIYLTEVFSNNIEGDSYFNYDIDLRKWSIVEEMDVPASDVDDFPYRFSIYKRRDATVRLIDIKNYMTDSANRERYIDDLKDKLLKEEGEGSRSGDGQMVFDLIREMR